MEHLWIWLTVFASLMQSVRIAGQKELNAHVSTMGTTYVRALVGLPVMIVYLAFVKARTGAAIPASPPLFLLHASLGAGAQIVGTAMLVQLLSLRSFAVGNMLIKTDIVMTALLGATLFSERVSPPGFAALLVILGGVVLLVLGGQKAAHEPGAKTGWMAAVFSDAGLLAFACAGLYTLSYLFLRAATLALPDTDFAMRGAWTVVVATLLQTVVVGAWLAHREPGVYGALWRNRGLSAFIGITSALGSIAWFTAFALQNASYVRAVGQCEMVFTILISRFHFKEHLSRLEIWGLAVTLLGVAMLRLWA